MCHDCTDRFQHRDVRTYVPVPNEDNVEAQVYHVVNPFIPVRRLTTKTSKTTQAPTTAQVPKAPTTIPKKTSTTSVPSGGTYVTVNGMIKKTESSSEMPRGLRGLGDKCIVCNKATDSWGEFTKHMLTHQPTPDPRYLEDCLLPNGRYQCIACGLQHCTKYRLKQHSLTHCTDFPFKCPLCSSKFKLKQEFYNHYSSMHGGCARDYSCDRCEYKATHKPALTSHLRTHMGKKRKWRCEVCFKWLTPRGLQFHYFLHTGEKPHRCTMCAMRFLRKERLSHHVKTRHLGIKEVTVRKHTDCPVCGKKVTLQNFEAHMRLHTDEPTDVCCICGMKFYNDKRYLIHMDMVHVGSKNESCSVCGKRFYGMPQVKQHMAVHTKEKPFKCEVCGKAFAWKHKVKGHMKTHSEERPFKCEPCGVAYKWKNNLSDHVKAKHV